MTGSPVRYVVTELVGWDSSIQNGGGARNQPGMSCHIIDTLVNHRLVVTFRTEQYGRGVPMRVRYERIRKQAAERCAELNAA